jgi:riboflavin synthase
MRMAAGATPIIAGLASMRSTSMSERDFVVASLLQKTGAHFLARCSMFTGIVTALGTIRSVRDSGDLHAVIAAPFDPAHIAIGASISCSGTCLTVVERGGHAGDAWFAVDISGETLACTVPGRWQAGARLNLESALKLGDELGGHIVTGHVDGVGDVVRVNTIGESLRLDVAAPRELAPYVAAKGSITLDGVSLTVNEVADQPDGSCHFALNIIPHTAEVTTLGRLVEGDKVNLEIDVLARYLMRMQSLRR